MERALRDCQQALTQVLDRQAQARPTRPSLCLAPGEIYAELVGLFAEFDDVECNLRQRTISVVTEPVVLDDVHLGPFRIELDLEYGDDGLPDYSVSPTDPHPATCDDEVTHPHVRDGGLCAGEGTVPIRRALEDGRLGDFFRIISQVLHTYNPGSAYVELDEWEGDSCAACGTSVAEDELVRCWASSESVCCECAVNCPECGHDFAPDRTEVCEGCEDPYCTNCLDEGLCHACREKARDEEHQHETRQREIESGHQPAEPAKAAPSRRGGLAADEERV
jgi:hypothetical protein